MIEVRILYTEGCDYYLPTINIIENTLNDLSIEAKLIKTLVTTFEDANQFRFIGSPTVQVNGLDIEPDARSVEQFGLT